MSIFENLIPKKKPVEKIPSPEVKDSVFDKPLSEVSDKIKSTIEENENYRENVNLNLISNIQSYINETRKMIEELPLESQKRLVLEEQIENNEVTLETLLSKISPEAMDELTKSPNENNKNPE